MASILDAMTISTFGFNVPCRRFLITANVTRDRRLPVVDEFYLRALRLCERVPARRLGAFFGLSESETEIVTSDLVARSLVQVEGDNVMLHPAAGDIFDPTSNGALPRITQIDTWLEHVWFDLVSRNIMPAERTRAARNLIDLPADALARSLPTSFAQQAFELNFANYVQKVRRIPESDGVSLYSVSGVEAGRFGYVVVRGREDLVRNGSFRVVPHMLEVDAASTDSFRPLSEAIWDAFRRLTMPSPSMAALTEFCRLTDDTSILDAHDGNGHFDMAKWYSALDGTSKARQPVMGASYLERNVALLAKMIEGSGGADALKDSVKLSLVWCRPTGTSWGASPDLDSALSTLRSTVRINISKATSTRSILVAPQVSKAEHNNRFERHFDEAYLAPAGYLSPAIEVLLVQNLAALVTVVVRVSDDICVPAGFIILDPKILASLMNAVRIPELRRQQPLWRRAGAGQNDENGQDFGAT